MGRFLVIVLTAVGLFAGAAWFFEFFHTEHIDKTQRGQKSSKIDRAKLGTALYEPIVVKQPTKVIADDPPDAGRRASMQIVVHDCHLSVKESSDIAAAKDGVLIFVGEEINQDGLNKSSLRSVKMNVGGQPYEVVYREWKEGDLVKEGQMLALVDPTRAKNELMYKKAKIVGAHADYLASVATYNEATARRDRLDQQKTGSPRSVSHEDYSAAQMLVEKYRQEVAGRQTQIELSKIEAFQAEVDLSMHEIRNILRGTSIIRTIHRKPGEGVKNLEAVMRIENLSRLRVEGLIDSRYFDELHRVPPEQRREKIRVTIEPTQEMGDEPLNKAHRGEINGVAVCPDPNRPGDPRFVSVSEDKSACVWRRHQVYPDPVLQHRSPVRSVACATRDQKSWCLTGCADGTITLWDLDNPGQPVLEWRDEHQDAITALAFSPDGRFFASGSQDNSIILWDAVEGKKLYAFDHEHGVDNPHQGTITALYFTPKSQLISASRDNTLRVWSLREKGAWLEGEPVADRGGAVTMPGVSADGERMVFDQGRTLMLLSTDEQRRPLGALETPPSATAFETLALFSPDGSMMLTAGGAEGRMQLWRTPNRTSRGYELRQFVGQDRSATTCAAFAPDSSFVVSGTKDGHVHLWILPPAKDLQSHRIFTDAANQRLTLDHVGRSLESGKVHVTATVQNPEVQGFPQGRLAPGRRVTLVIDVDQ